MIEGPGDFKRVISGVLIRSGRIYHNSAVEHCVQEIGQPMARVPNIPELVQKLDEYYEIIGELDRIWAGLGLS